jgi:hypothetical protein
MNTRQRITVVLVLVMGLVVSGCGSSPALSPTPTIMPFPPTPAPTVTQVSVPSDMVTPPPTPIPLITEAPVSLKKVEGTYNINGVAPNGKDYSGKLTITLNSYNTGSFAKQAVYDLAWDNGSTGAGILIKDALATNFLATSFGGPTCGAVFYSVDYSVDSNMTLTGPWLKLGTKEIGTEIASSTVSRSTLDGDYNVVGYNANGSEYNGTLSLIRQGNVWQLTWNVGQSYNGVGISLNKSLFATAYGGEDCGVSVYKVNTDGSLHATWAVSGVNQVGEETATK